METKTYKRNEEIRSVQIVGNKVNTRLDNGTFNPTLEEFLAEGWEEYTPTPYEPTRDEKIHAEIREKYSENDEYMILRHKASDPETYAEEFSKYDEYVESIIAKYPEV